MKKQSFDSLWRSFPKTLPEFEEHFKTEEMCREYFAKVRWGGEPVCQKCGCSKLWPERDGTIYECSDCGYQMSLTAGTLFHGTRKPLKLWFWAIWEICVHRHGISAADLQRVLGLGSYETAWAWLHKIRRAMVRENRDKLDRCAQADEIFIGGKGAPKEIVVVVAEENGRIRLTHAPNNDEHCIKHVVNAEIGPKTTVKTDGHASYNKTSLKDRTHEPKVQSKQEKQDDDYLQLCHWVAANLKRWLLGTHHDGVQPKHLQSYLDEFSFRFNRRHTNGVGRIAARCLENMVTHKPLTLRQIIDTTHKCRKFAVSTY